MYHHFACKVCLSIIPCYFQIKKNCNSFDYRILDKHSRRDVYGDDADKYEVGIFHEDEMISKGTTNYLCKFQLVKNEYVF